MFGYFYNHNDLDDREEVYTYEELESLVNDEYNNMSEEERMHRSINVDPTYLQTILSQMQKWDKVRVFINTIHDSVYYDYKIIHGNIADVVQSMKNQGEL